MPQGDEIVRQTPFFRSLLEKYDLLTVGLAESSLIRAKGATILWLREDYCAPLLTEGEALLLAQVASPT
jgi:hypothetical protein